MLANTQFAISALRDLQQQIRDVVISSRDRAGLSDAVRSTAADTIYSIDAHVEPVIDAFCRDWSRKTPLVLIAEGIEDARGNEGSRVYPEGAHASDAQIRLIIDPIDGTRGLMYDKRSAWSLAGVAPNNGDGTSLRDIEVAAMTELPTSKMGFGDALWAIRGQGARGERVDLSNKHSRPLCLAPSHATTIDHGFASISNFFPGTKMLASALMEHIVSTQIGPADVTRATVFDDQYISTAGQWYELFMGHDRFNADLRPVFYRMQKQPLGMCCHPYDCAAVLIAEEAGVIITDEHGSPLDAILDCSSPVSWVGYANPHLRDSIEPHVRQWLNDHQLRES